MEWSPRPAGVDITAHYVDLAILPVEWLLMAIIIGSFRQGQIRLEVELRRENARLKRMSEDLAAEVDRMDSDVAALELQIATANPDDAEAGLAALSVLAKADAETFEARFTEAVAALGFAGAAFYVGAGAPVRIGAAPQLTAPEVEKLRWLVSDGRTTNTAVDEGTEVAVGVGDDGFLVTMTSRPSAAVTGGFGDSAAGEEQSATPALSSKAVTRTIALAAALAFSGFGPPIYLRPTGALDLEQISQ